MTELRAGATVRGTDKDLGTVDALVIDPTARTVTHLVVNHDPLARRVLVPMSAVARATPDVVQVTLDEQQLQACPMFDEPVVDVDDTGPMLLGFEPGAYFLEPFASPLDGWALSEHEHIPEGEITIRRGDDVVTSDGVTVGHVDEFLVDPADGHVTHVVLREGNVLHHDDVVVPLGATSFDEGRVVLGLADVDVRDLERIPVRRHGHVRREHLDD